ncbi:uncharacterized protein LOC130627999 [Hydractinia symbiolongicarpus]|uniref:uncharacterized protein LOC130627999 n=1 Tax=Hydractinia symbiolongicarpus TaxID=13093 RepID=UPI002550C9FA|nr:uncharacterized protein LOC130627999 [Hydractinia symbiolongicarpus]
MKAAKMLQKIIFASYLITFFPVKAEQPFCNLHTLFPINDRVFNISKEHCGSRFVVLKTTSNNYIQCADECLRKKFCLSIYFKRRTDAVDENNCFGFKDKTVYLKQCLIDTRPGEIQCDVPTVENFFIQLQGCSRGNI